MVEAKEVLTFSSDMEVEEASTSRNEGEESCMPPSHEEGEIVTPSVNDIA